MTGEGREFALTTDRYRAAKYQWPLYGDEFVARMSSPRPEAVGSHGQRLIGHFIFNGGRQQRRV
jgi:hypothetical protein